MNIRTILILVAVAGAGAYVYVDYNSVESKLAREIKELGQLAPGVQPPDCFGKGLNAKLFAVGVDRDRRPNSEIADDNARKGAIKHDCVRGNNPATLQRVVKALGPAGIATYAQVLKSCPVVKDEYPTYACFALDALNADGSKEAIAVLENEVNTYKDKTRRNVYEGALYRLMMTPGWTTTPKLAERLPKETEWEAKELMMEYIRNHRDMAAKPALEAAYTAETDAQEKGLIKSALLELDNPGKCVATGEGRIVDGLCRYVCHDQNRWFSLQNTTGGQCPLVQEVPADTQAGAPAAAATPPPVNAASPVTAPAKAAAPAKAPAPAKAAAKK
jgi:hypothetical protein